VAVKMSVFNIASAALTWQSYLQNSTDTHVSYNSYCLSITELAFVCVVMLCWLAIISVAQNNINIFPITFITINFFNIVYSNYTITYFSNHIPVDLNYANMTLAIMIINSLACCGCCGIFGMDKELFVP
jgi:hypothetical protein